MSIGLQPSKASIDSETGALARDITNLLRRAAGYKTYLAQLQDSDLTALGYTSTDIANLRATFDDLNQLHDISIGAATLTVAKDFRSYARWLYGTGCAT